MSKIPPRSARIHSETFTITWNLGSTTWCSIISRSARTFLTPATPRATMERWKRKVSPASRMMVGIPARVAAARSVPPAAGWSIMISVPKAFAIRRTLSSSSSPRMWAKLVRPTPAVCMSMPYWACCTISVKILWATRCARFPCGSPGKYRLRSRRPGRYREWLRKPHRFSTGVQNTVPRSLAGSSSVMMVRTISTPFSSSP